MHINPILPPVVLQQLFSLQIFYPHRLNLHRQILPASRTRPKILLQPIAAKLDLLLLAANHADHIQLRLVDSELKQLKAIKGVSFAFVFFHARHIYSPWRRHQSIK